MIKEGDQGGSSGFGEGLGLWGVGGGGFKGGARGVGGCKGCGGVQLMCGGCQHFLLCHLTQKWLGAMSI